MTWVWGRETLWPLRLLVPEGGPELFVRPVLRVGQIGRESWGQVSYPNILSSVEVRDVAPEVKR